MNLVHERNGYIRGIDGLRALAVVAVMLFHIDPSILPGGFSGVDVFFVISGYVISASLARDTKPGFFSYIAGFYARRIVRIIPALIACLATVGVVVTLLVPESWLSGTIADTGRHAYFGLGNYALIWFDDGYFSPRTEFNPFAHTWTLGVEEQFYAIFPLIMFAWIKCEERKNRKTFVVGLLAALSISSFIYSYVETGADPDRAFYLLPSRFWELACGALLFMLHSRRSGRMARAGSAMKRHLHLLAGTMLVGLGFVFSDKQSFPFPWALLPVVGTVFLISGVADRSGNKPAMQRIFESPIFVWTGKISYSLYLWHWPVYVLFRWTAGLETATEAALAVMTTFAMAILSYWFVEKPVRTNRWIAGRQNWRIVAAVVAFFFFFRRDFQTAIDYQPERDEKPTYMVSARLAE